MRAIESGWLAVALLAACGGGAIRPAELTLNEEACSHCRMLVSQRPFAAQAVTRSGRTDFFDDIGCLAAWAREHATGGPGKIGLFVVDFETGKWLDARAAFYVHAAGLDTPMSSGLAAFAERKRAGAFAARLKGGVVGWPELVKGPPK